MDSLIIIFGALLATLAGLFTGYAWGLAKGRREAASIQQQLAALDAKYQAESAHSTQQLTELKELKTQIENTFKALSSEALQKNNAAFLELAHQRFATLQEGAKGDLEKRQQAIGELLQPVRTTLEKVEANLIDLERKRIGAYSGLQEQVRSLLETQGRLQKETGNLVTALRAPNVRGRWGEIQLERTVEFAGMREHVDFLLQASTTDSEQGRLRPDMVVRLPNGKNVVVDAKAPLDAYLSALEAEEPEKRAAHLLRHARQIRDHVRALSSKQYWRQFELAPEFVVLFLPGEAFFSAALESDPGLIESSAAENVLIATPTTLIALLKAVAYGWKQEAVAIEAREISLLGRELYERICTQTGHLNDLGKALERSVDAYNKSMRSLETRVLVSARRFQELSTKSEKDLPTQNIIDTRPINIDGDP